jgi:hypothetical protein
VIESPFFLSSTCTAQHGESLDFFVSHSRTIDSRNSGWRLLNSSLGSNNAVARPCIRHSFRTIPHTHALYTVTPCSVLTASRWAGHLEIRTCDLVKWLDPFQFFPAAPSSSRMTNTSEYGAMWSICIHRIDPGSRHLHHFWGQRFGPHAGPLSKLLGYRVRSSYREATIMRRRRKAGIH